MDLSCGQKPDCTYEKPHKICLAALCSTSLVCQTVMSTRSVISFPNNKLYQEPFPISSSHSESEHSDITSYCDPITRVNYYNSRCSKFILHKHILLEIKSDSDVDRVFNFPDFLQTVFHHCLNSNVELSLGNMVNHLCLTLLHYTAKY